MQGGAFFGDLFGGGLCTRSQTRDALWSMINNIGVAASAVSASAVEMAEPQTALEKTLADTKQMSWDIAEMKLEDLAVCAIQSYLFHHLFNPAKADELESETKRKERKAAAMAQLVMRAMADKVCHVPLSSNQAVTAGLSNNKGKGKGKKAGKDRKGKDTAGARPGRRGQQRLRARTAAAVAGTANLKKKHGK